jgi:hypothetical protein
MFIREKVLECRQQEGAKASALPIRCREQIGRQHVHEELLRQVLGVNLRCVLPTDVGVQRNQYTWHRPASAFSPSGDVR